MHPRWFKLWYQFEKKIALFLVAMLSCLVLLDVVAREILRTGLPWAQKAAVFMMIWTGFIGASLTSFKGQHLRPEIAEKIWPKKWSAFYFRSSQFIIALFCLCMSYFSLRYTLTSWELGDKNVVLNLPLWIVQLIIPLTFISMFLRHVFYTLNPHWMPEKEGIH